MENVIISKKKKKEKKTDGFLGSIISFTSKYTNNFLGGGYYE